VITPTQGIQNALTNKNIQVIYQSGTTDLAAAATLAQSCDLTLVVVATYSSEGSDRENLSLPDEHNSLVTTVRANNLNTIVAINAPGAVLLPWNADVSTVLMNFYPGQEFGNALADVLFGKVNPSARLPITLPNQENEIAFTPRQYPGIGVPPEAYYTEGLLIGYRWYDANNVTPLYPFGHGLSYTRFTYSSFTQVRDTYSMKSSLVTAMTTPKVAGSSSISKKVYSSVNDYDVTISNTGDRDGEEVVQLYLEYPKAAREPPKQLRNFNKVSVKKGESSNVHFTLSERDCSIWNEEEHSWQMLPGQYTVHVGSSSRDIRASIHFLVVTV
jgi:beta-glucosidase